LGYTTQLSTMI